MFKLSEYNQKLKNRFKAKDLPDISDKRLILIFSKLNSKLLRTTLRLPLETQFNAKNAMLFSTSIRKL
jgi:hypothetical protein